MKKIGFYKFIAGFIFLVFPLLVSATVNLPPYIPKVYEKKATNSPRVFILSGAHGDEPGGYLSALYLYKTLNLKNGDVKFLPFLNIKTIVRTYRYLDAVGDINDKFAFSKSNSLQLPEDVFRKIGFVKKEIEEFKPDFVLSLHAGWGFSIRDKRRWGNSITIDEKRYKNIELYSKAEKVLNAINLYNPYRYENYSIKVLNTFSKNVKSEMNDFSTWVLKSGFPVYTIESSKNLSLWRQIYNTSFATIKFLKLYGFKIENEKAVLNRKNIEKFLSLLRKKKIKIEFMINNKTRYYFCKYGKELKVPVDKTAEISIPEIEINDFGYFLIPKSEFNYKKRYNFKRFINFKIKYLDVNRKKYSDYCFIKFVVKRGTASSGK
ncbi:M99 family carboxypeptidase catalytic domain-containing protein [Desulfurobacterium sp.]